VTVEHWTAFSPKTRRVSSCNQRSVLLRLPVTTRSCSPSWLRFHATLLSQYISLSYISILPTSLTNFFTVNQSLLNLETCCGLRYGRRVCFMSTRIFKEVKGSTIDLHFARESSKKRHSFSKAVTCFSDQLLCHSHFEWKKIAFFSSSALLSQKENLCPSNAFSCLRVGSLILVASPL